MPDDSKVWQQRADSWMKQLPPLPDTPGGQGIVISAGGMKYFTCAWVCAKMLRLLKCELPIEFWYLGRSEMDDKMQEMAAEIPGVRCVDGVKAAEKFPLFRWGERPGWQLKALSLVATRFEEALLLDGDNVPITNPEFLFNTPQYKKAGAIFWPDYKRLAPSRSIWHICGVDYRDEPEFESGQIVVDRRRCWRELWLSLHYNVQSRYYYQHIWGDKDTFHMAWRRLNTAYSMPPYAIKNLDNRVMCQHDFDGRVIFQHRNLAKWVIPSRSNMRISGFQHEGVCLTFLQQLEAKWNGQIAPPRPMKPVELEVYRDITLAGTFIYKRIGYDQRMIEFSANQTITRGKAECEQVWYVEEKEGVPELVIEGGGMTTCRLRKDENGLWKGRWLHSESMPIELTPCSITAATAASQDNPHWNQLVKQRYVYIRVNHDKQLLELQEDGTTMIGGHRQTWELLEEPGRKPRILLRGKQGVMVQLTEHPDGVWRGKYVEGERLAVNLVPIPD